MTHRSVYVVILGALTLSIATKAQSGSAAIPGLGLAPAKIAVISIQSAIGATNDGQKDFQALDEKFDPKRSELKSLSDEIDNLKKQLEVQGSKLNDEARTTLGRQIDSKQKALSRMQEDAQNDFSEQQNEIAQKVLRKLIPIVDNYAKQNSLSLVIDGSKPWPEWPVFWASPSVDITKAVVEIYNAQSGIPAAPGPRSGGTSHPAPPAKTSEPGSPKP
jgi:outer membrane protein